MKRIISLLAFGLLLITQSKAQTFTGKWKTIDDETGKAKSIVEVYEKDGKLYGKVVKLFRAPNEDQNPNCKLCPGDRKDKKVLGMEVLRNCKKDGKEYVDGTILDPKNGKVYDCKLWIENGKLHLRGYVGFLYRTQVWLPYKE